jgi:hypothetical protein
MRGWDRRLGADKEDGEMAYTIRSSAFHGRCVVGEFDSFAEAINNAGCATGCRCGGSTVHAHGKQIDLSALPADVLLSEREPTADEVRAALVS